LINEEDATIAAAVGRAGDAIAGFIEAVLARMEAGDAAGLHGGEGPGPRLVYFGAGTSGRLGVLDASECPPTFQTPPGMVVGVIAGGDAALRVSSEGKEDEEEGAREEIDRLGIGPRDSVLGIAAGGTTPYVLGALRRSAARGALTGLLTCARAATPAFVAHHIVVETGAEVVTGSTRMKAGTATKMVLNSISTTLMVRLGKVYENLMVDLRATNDKLRDRAVRIVAMLTGAEREEAIARLEHAGGSCKTAIVMHARRCSKEDAVSALARARGRLREAITPPPGGDQGPHSCSHPS
jgi:N-acetylmuramic acid 6-phosphate etherase